MTQHAAPSAPRAKKTPRPPVEKVMFPSTVAQAARDEIQQKVRKLAAERSALLDGIEAATRKGFFATGGCERCHGRGWVVVWDTMDSMSGCYAEYGQCPEAGCTAKVTGPLHYKNPTKYDRNRGVAALEDTPSVKLLLSPYDMQLEALNRRLRDAQSRLDRVLAPRKGERVIVARGRKVPLGTVGRVFWEGSGEWGSRFGVDTGLPDPQKPGKTIVAWVAANNCDLYEE